MSRYSNNIAEALINALSTVPSAQPAQVAGYWANRSFFLDEFRHCLHVAKGYDDRVERMRAAYDQYIREHGGPHHLDEFGDPIQEIARTTSAPERRKTIGDVRSALKAVAERALNLKIATISEYDDFIEQLKVD